MRKAGLWFLTQGNYVIHTKSNELFQKNFKQMTGGLEDMEFPGVFKKENGEIPVFDLGVAKGFT